MLRLQAAVLAAAAGAVSLATGVSSDAASLRPTALDRPAGTSSLPTTASGRYLIAGGWASIGTMLRVGNTVYVGGAFSQIVNRTGSTIVVRGSGGAPEPGFAEVAGGSVNAAVADDRDGWYLGGTFTNVGGTSRPGLAHVRGDGSLDMTFAPEEFGEVHGVALAGGVLFVGGVQVPAQHPTPIVRALDATTGSVLPITYTSPADALDATAVVAGAGRLYVAFDRRLNSAFDSTVVAFDAATGIEIWSHSFPFEALHEGATTLAPYGAKLLVGGEFGDAGNQNLEALDASTGALTGPNFQVPTSVSSIAVVGDKIYVARKRTKLASSGLDVIDPVTGAEKSWGLIRAELVAANGNTLFVSGRTAADEQQGVRDRVYSAQAGTAKAVLHQVSPALGGAALALAPQGSRLLIGGTFAGAGGVARSNLAAFDVRTGKLLPWRPTSDGVVTGIAAWNHKIYLGGYFTHVQGKSRRRLAAVTEAGAGRLLPWRPGLSWSDGISLAIGHGRVFVGGTFILQGQKQQPGKRIRFTHLAAFSAAGAGARVRFASHALNKAPVGPLSGGGVLAVRRRTLLLAEPSGVTAFSVDGDGRHELWRRPVRGAVNAFATSGTTLYIGGRFSLVGGRPRTNLAALALDRRGALLPFAPAVTQDVVALAPLGGELVYSVSTRRNPGQPAWRQVLGAAALDGTIEPWRMDADNSVDCIVPFSGGLVVAGPFDWLGSPGHQAAARIGWLR